tara:strand:+ start:85 stop:789 length:705 start_codon:yes stop_codon:yes gene_type:complete
MPLPKLAVPEYSCTLPVTELEVTYRPFLVKEEKLLYLAMESGDEKEMINSVKKIIKDCTNVKKVDDLPIFEIEYLFLRIRAKAVGEVSEFKLTCPDDNETKVDYSLDLEEVNVVVPEGHTKKIKIDDKIGVVMKYPSLVQFVNQNLKEEEASLDDLFDLAAQCVDKVFDEEEIYDSFTKKEALEFLEGMSSEQFAKVQEFFETIPKLTHTITVTNPKTKKESEIVLEGLAAFFA